MPTIKRFSKCKITIYADDHYPPHFHILGPDFAVQVELSSFEIMGGVARKSDISEALDWAFSNAEMIRRKWDELNSR